MPPRISRSSVQGSAPPKTKGKAPARKPKKAQKRALDAFSIAGHEAPDRVKIRPNRLGEIEGGAQRKRRRDLEDEEEDEEEDGGESKRRRRGEDSYDEGSDSEGNHWTMGHVEDGDDSDIDSDEAFGDSDEERFEGWTFRGSSSNQKSKPKKKPKAVEADDDEDMDIDLNEGESADGEEEDEDEDEDDLGEDAIDLATALDQYEESEEEREKEKKQKKKNVSAFDDSSDESPSEGEDIGRDGFSDFSSDEDEDEEDKNAQLKSLISSLPQEEEKKDRGPRKVEVHEGGTPSEFGVLRKVDLSSLKPKTSDPEAKKALKLLQDDVKSSKRNDIARKLDAPLPKRQQDKLDRAVANEKANETLERWVDTIKQNRQAEHLSFPLKHPNAGKASGETRLMPTTTAAPTNELESTIQSILQQSGLSTGKDDEEQIQKWEELQINKLPLEEVLRRRAQLRKERELLFREEVRAKRIKKIKSKAYRRVHRKERERLMEKEREQLKADGVDISEDEREYNDRRRAEERMGAKHRESRWAKGVKATGRAAWDDDARSGVTDMARRNEELRRRIEGKTIRDEDDEGSDFSSEEESDDGDDDDALKKQLGRLKENPFSTDNSKLGSMAFMQRAEAAKRAQNDEDIERMRKELAGEESNESESEDENAARVGRRKFGPGAKTATPAVQVKGSEFEERPGSDDEEATNVASMGRMSSGAPNGASTGAKSSSQNPYLSGLKAKKSTKETGPDLASQAVDTIAALQVEPTSSKAKAKSKAKSKKPKKSSNDEDEVPEPTISAPDDDGWQTVTYKNNDGSEDEDDDGIEDDGIDLDIVTRNNSLTARGFAGDNVEEDFAKEKAETVKQEDAKTVVNHLPGWGAWAGEGLTASEKKHKGKRTVTKQQGIRPDKRKDAKNDRAIINEKRVKANSKYLASQLPHQFETKDQYERALRMPQGPEWQTKKSFQDATKPRLLVKQGIIRPMHKPLV